MSRDYYGDEPDDHAACPDCGRCPCECGPTYAERMADVIHDERPGDDEENPF